MSVLPTSQPSENTAVSPYAQIKLKRSSILFLLLFLLNGCATRTVQHHMTAYKDCVYSQAMDMVASAYSTEDITRIAAAQCQNNLAIVNQTLREDNAWMEHYGSNADGYTEKLRDKTTDEVSEAIRNARGR